MGEAAVWHNAPVSSDTGAQAFMEPPDVFTVRDLRDRPEDLLRDAEQGRMAIITKDGRPAMLAIPFDLRLLEHGVHRSVALHLFESGQVTLAKGARLASLSLE